MLVNDLFGVSRSNVMTGDACCTQIPTPVGTLNTNPFACNVVGGNFGVQAYHPLYGMVVNRIPQSYVHQGVVPQTLGNVGVPGVQQHYVPVYTHPFALTYPTIHNNGMGNVGYGHTPYGMGNVGYGYSPYGMGTCNWINPMGVQTQLCR